MRDVQAPVHDDESLQLLVSQMGVENAQVLPAVKWVSDPTWSQDCNTCSCGSANGGG